MGETDQFSFEKIQQGHNKVGLAKFALIVRNWDFKL
jgi:hypothetical protein